MTAEPRVVGVVGSLNDGSVTSLAMGRALDAAAARARTEPLDLREYDLPVFDPSAEPTDSIVAADSVLLGTPMYHGSCASPLKTALDCCGFDEFEETTVGLLAVSGGGGFPLPAPEHLRAVCRAFEAWVSHTMPLSPTHTASATNCPTVTPWPRTATAFHSASPRTHSLTCPEHTRQTFAWACAQFDRATRSKTRPISSPARSTNPSAASGVISDPPSVIFGVVRRRYYGLLSLLG